jgi:hypothetical protein
MEVVFDSADGMGSNSLVSAAGCQALPAAVASFACSRPEWDNPGFLKSVLRTSGPNTALGSCDGQGPKDFLSVSFFGFVFDFSDLFIFLKLGSY